MTRSSATAPTVSSGRSASGVVCLPGCKASHYCVLGRPQRYGPFVPASLRPCPARFSPAITNEPMDATTRLQRGVTIPTLADVETARGVIAPYVRPTPLLAHAGLR